MAVSKADEYRHNNPDNAFVDSNFVRGGRRKVDNRAALYALVVKADQLAENVTVVRILTDVENGNVATEVLLVDAARIGEAAGWQTQLATGERRLAPIEFENTSRVLVRYTTPYPPTYKVYGEDGYKVECEVRLIRASQILEFTFSIPTSGIITF